MQEVESLLTVNSSLSRTAGQKIYGPSLFLCSVYSRVNYLAIKFHTLSHNLVRERHHEPIGSEGLDEKELNWIKHQGMIFLHSPPAAPGSFCNPLMLRIITISVPGHHILPSKSVGHLLLLTEHREHEKFFLWGWLFRTV